MKWPWIVIFLSFSLHAQVTWLVEFAQRPNEQIISKIQKLKGVESIDLFDDYSSDYFSRLYQLEIKTDDRESLKLKIKELIKVNRIEGVDRVEAFSIIPNPKPNRLEVEDTFFPYQWGLFNDRQTIRIPQEENSELIHGEPGIDIGWAPIRKELPNLMKKEVVVAVLDTGVALEHNDLAAGLVRNEVECVKGPNPLPFNTKEDNDNNGYPGDCLGWNFFSSKNMKDGDNRAYDDVGHGTHVTGIIAARAQFGEEAEGVRGVSNNIKVLPVRVMGRDDEGDKDGSRGEAQGVSLTHRISKGILYAIKMKVDVINMSLGWPRSLDKEYLRESMREALKHNITIVAAAGNNTSNQPIFPCAYEGVICVGSISADGRVSDFSNYGGKVDLLAPGHNIVSTYPRKIQQTLFPVEGYEVLNGTSQSAPFVAAAAAILKSINPDISNDELAARLYASSKKTDHPSHETLYSNHGFFNLSQAIKSRPKASLKPNFKELRNIIYFEGIEDFTWEVKIKNYWKKSSPFKVKIWGEGQGAKLERQAFKVDSLASGDEVKIISTGKIIDSKLDNIFHYWVEIIHEGKSEIFRDEVEIIRKIEDDEDLIHIPFVKRDPKLQLSRRIRGEDIPQVNTIIDYYQSQSMPDYFVELRNLKEKTLQVAVFQFHEGQFLELEQRLVIPNGLRLYSIMHLDANFDGEMDYFVRSLAKGPGESGQQYFVYSFFDRQGNPLYGEHSHWKFIPETSIIDFVNLSFIPYDIIGLGKVAVPYYMSAGYTPEAELSPNPFESSPNYEKMHIYYHLPKLTETGVEISTKVWNKYDVIEKLKKDLALEYGESLVMLSPFPQSRKQLSHGEVTFLISFGENYLKDHYTLHLRANGAWFVVPYDNRFSHFQQRKFSNIIDLDEYPAEFRAGLVAEDQYSVTKTRWDSMLTQSSQVNGVYEYERDDAQDHLLGFMGAYYKEGETYSFFHTRTQFLMIHDDGKNEDLKIQSRPIARFSFLPGKLFNEIFYPIVRVDEFSGENFPAYFVNSTQLNTNHLYIVTPKKGELAAPMDMSVDIPTECDPLNPVRIDDHGQMAFTLLCSDEGDWNIIFLPIH